MAIKCGFAIVIVVTAGILAAGFLFGISLDVLGLITVDTASPGGTVVRARVDLFATAGLAVLLSAALWGAGRIRRVDQRGNE